MQLFSAGVKIFLAHEYMKKLPSKVAYFSRIENKIWLDQD